MALHAFLKPLSKYDVSQRVLSTTDRRPLDARAGRAIFDLLADDLEDPFARYYGSQEDGAIPYYPVQDHALHGLKIMGLQVVHDEKTYTIRDANGIALRTGLMVLNPDPPSNR